MVLLTAARTEPFISANVWTAIFMLGNLLLLYFIMKKFLFKPVKKMIDDRQQEIDDLYANANKSKSDAAELKAQYETRLAEANEEKEEILRSAHRKAQLREEEILREANDKAARVMKRAEEQVEMEKKRAINEVKNEVSDMAIGIASAVINGVFFLGQIAFYGVEIVSGPVLALDSLYPAGLRIKMHPVHIQRFIEIIHDAHQVHHRSIIGKSVHKEIRGLGRRSQVNIVVKIDKMLGEAGNPVHIQLQHMGAEGGQKFLRDIILVIDDMQFGVIYIQPGG